MASRPAALALFALLAAAPARADEAVPAAPPAPASEGMPPVPPAPPAAPAPPARAPHVHGTAVPHRCRHCAHPGHRRTDWVLLRGGAFLAQDSDLRAANTGFEAELAVGRDFYPFLAGEVSAGAYFVDADPDFHLVGGTTPVAAKQSLRGVPVSFTMKLGLPSGSIRPYLLAGGGVHIGSFTRDPTDTGASVTWEDTWFALHLGAGATWRISPRLFAAFEGRYQLGTAQVFAENVNVDAFRATGGLGWRL